MIPEPLGGAHRDHQLAAATLKEAVLRHLRELLPLSPEELVEHRYRKFQRIGAFTAFMAIPFVAPAALYFQDSFDRADSLDIDAAAIVQQRERRIRGRE